MGCAPRGTRGVAGNRRGWPPARPATLSLAMAAGRPVARARTPPRAARTFAEDPPSRAHTPPRQRVCCRLPISLVVRATPAHFFFFFFFCLLAGGRLKKKNQSTHHPPHEARGGEESERVAAAAPRGGVHTREGEAVPPRAPAGCDDREGRGGGEWGEGWQPSRPGRPPRGGDQDQARASARPVSGSGARRCHKASLRCARNKTKRWVHRH